MIVQKIPPNRSQSKMGVNEKGKIVIQNYEGKIKVVSDIDKAIRQQAIYIPLNYRDALVTFINSFSIRHTGQITTMNDIMGNIDNLKATLEDLGKKEQLQDNIKKLQNDFQDIKEILPDMIKKQLNIVFTVQQRALLLIEEKERCEKIIDSAIEIFAQTYKHLTESYPEMIRWTDVFKALKALDTVKVNPFKERVQNRTIQILKGKGKDKQSLFKVLRKGDVKLAKKRLWQALLKILPIYSSRCAIEINGTMFILEKGSIKIGTAQGRE